MTEQKITDFFMSAANKTKTNKLSWARLSSLPLEVRRMIYTASPDDADVNFDQSFLAKYNDGEIVLLFDEIDGTISCLIKPDKNLSYQCIGEPDSSALVRLYNLVYSLFPSVDTFLDQFIQDPD